MGIRINKMLGYGLNDLEHDGEKLVDERINYDSPLFARGEELPDPEEYVQWLEDNKRPSDLDRSYFRDREQLRKIDIEKATLAVEEKLQEITAASGLALPLDDIAGALAEAAAMSYKQLTQKYQDLYSVYEYSDEFGLANTIVFRPFSCKDWERYDNIMDYLEEGMRFKGTPIEVGEPHVVLLEDGIFPWSGSYWDVRNGKRLKASDTQDIRWWKQMYPDETTPSEHILKIIENNGFSSYEEYLEFAKPVVPQDIINIVEFLEVFKDPATIRQMKPMLYTLWH